MLNVFSGKVCIVHSILPSPSSDGFGGVPHQLYRLPPRGPLAIKIWAVLLYHGHIVSCSCPVLLSPGYPPPALLPLCSSFPPTCSPPPLFLLPTCSPSCFFLSFCLPFSVASLPPSLSLPLPIFLSLSLPFSPFLSSSSSHFPYLPLYLLLSETCSLPSNLNP